MDARTSKNNEPGRAGHRARLRERLLEAGPTGFHDYELIEYLLTLTIPRVDTKPLAKRLLQDFGGIGPLLGASADTLRREGLSDAAVAALKIAEATALRLLEARIEGRPVLSSWDALGDYLHATMAHRRTEEVRILFLNMKKAVVRTSIRQYRQRVRGEFYMLAYRYHRFSSKAQDRGSSLERQQQATAALCTQMGWSVAETLEDLGRSAWKGDHLRVGNLGQFKNRVDAGEIASGSILVVENFDRLSRESVKKARRWIEEITEAGIKVAVCSPAPKVFDEASLSGDNIVDLLTYLLEAKRAREESDRKSVLLQGMWKRHLAGARGGRIFTARCPGWLRVVGVGDERRFEEIPEHVEVVRLIYQMSAEGFGAYAICGKLNDLGIKPWGRNFYKHPATYWRHRYVRDVLLSPAVEGEYHPQSDGHPTGERIEGYYPRIVDAELVARGRAGLRDRRGTGGSHRSAARNLFAGKVKCGHCGNNMVRTVQRQKFEYFICAGAQTKSGCTNRGYRYDYFEKAVLDQILHLALDDKFFHRPDETKPLVAALAEADKAIENKQAEQQRLLGFVMRNPDAAEAEALLNAMRPELATMHKERDKMRGELEKARGSVSPEEHRQRVLAVSNAIYADEMNVREAARRTVREAIASVVDSVVCEAKPEKRIQVSLAGGRVGYQFDNRGNILQAFNLYNRPDLQRGSKGIGEEAWQNIKRRGQAA